MTAALQKLRQYGAALHSLVSWESVIANLSYKRRTGPLPCPYSTAL